MDKNFKQNLNWGSWKFSSNSEELLKSLITKTENIESNYNSEDFEKWHWLLDLQKTNKEQDENEESFVESTSSSDLDENENWEEIKKYMNRKTPKINLELHSEMDTSKVDDFEDKSNEQEEMNLLSQFDATLSLQKMDVDRGKTPNDAIQFGPLRSLLEILKKDEPDSEAVCKILSSGITKENLGKLWSNISSEVGKFCLICSLSVLHLHSVFVCKELLLPWLAEVKMNELRDIIERLSESLPGFGESAVKFLIYPLTSSTDSAFIKDLDLLKDIMVRFSNQSWALLFQEFISNMKASIERWQLPLITMLLESMKECNINAPAMNKLIHLMNSSSSDFAQDRDFGSMIVATINTVAKMDNSQILIREIAKISENYKGSLRFKISNLIKKVSS